MAQLSRYGRHGNRTLILVFASMGMFLGSQFIDPVSLALVMSTQVSLVIPSYQNLVSVSRRLVDVFAEKIDEYFRLAPTFPARAMCLPANQFPVSATR